MTSVSLDLGKLLGFRIMDNADARVIGAKLGVKSGGGGGGTGPGNGSPTDPGNGSGA